MAANLNRGKNLLGKDVGVGTDFSIGAAVNPNMTDFSPQLRHLRNKIAAGAHFAMTQPLYEAEKVLEFVAATRGFGIKLFIGVMPVLSSRTAEYLHHEVPGISVPETVRNALRKNDDALYQMETGLEFARKLITEIAPHVDGLYFIAPHAKPEIIAPLVMFAKKLR
jgi:homocysteine S-methyltransferase